MAAYLQINTYTSEGDWNLKGQINNKRKFRRNKTIQHNNIHMITKESFDETIQYNTTTFVCSSVYERGRLKFKRTNDNKKVLSKQYNTTQQHLFVRRCSFVHLFIFFESPSFVLFCFILIFYNYNHHFWSPFYFNRRFF